VALPLRGDGLNVVADGFKLAAEGRKPPCTRARQQESEIELDSRQHCGQNKPSANSSTFDHYRTIAPPSATGITRRSRV
jgi:hypothetical protein